ncbi:group II intron maturase-specific domain-containing protein [Streptomyces sp. M19]
MAVRQGIDVGQVQGEGDREADHERHARHPTAPNQSGAAGWTAYFQHGVSSHTFHYLSHYVWWLVGRWLRKKHRRANRKQLRLRYRVDRWLWADPTENVRLYLAASREVTRYRFRGERIPTPWAEYAARQLA